MEQREQQLIEGAVADTYRAIQKLANLDGGPSPSETNAVIEYLKEGMTRIDGLRFK